MKLPPNEEAKVESDCQIGGPWIPCVKIDKERNRVVLNPYAREPSDFYEKDFDKKFNVQKYILAHLQNMILVTNLPHMSSKTKEVAHQLKDLFQISSLNISEILMPIQPSLTGEDSSQPKTTSDETKRFCFIQFHYCASMVEFIQKYKKEGKFKVYSAYDIAHLLSKKEEDVPTEFAKAIKLIRDHINIPKSKGGDEGLKETIESINKAYQSIVLEKEQSVPSLPHQELLNVSHQMYSDKLMVIRDQNSIKLISRDYSTNEFELQSTNFSTIPMTLTSITPLKMKQIYLDHFFKTINWHQLLKEDNLVVQAITSQFFEHMKQSTVILKDNLVFKVPLIIAKFFIEFATQQARSQLDRIRRAYSANSTVIQSTSIISRGKNEQELEIIKQSALFYQNPNHSVDDLFFLLQILSDLNEQLWAQTRSSKCPPVVKALLNSVSRPNSALNRLGSFISWGFAGNTCNNAGSLSPLQMAENGIMECKDGGATVCIYGNQQLEINDLSRKTLTDLDILQETLGTGNRFLNGLVCENIPLTRSLNYLPPTKLFQYQITSIIPSSNSGYVLIGGQQGIINICHSLLELVPLKTMSFFQNDMEKKQKKYKEMLTKIEARKNTFDTYKESISKKSVILSISKDLKPKNDENKQDQVSKAEKKKQQKAQKIQKAKQAKQLAKEIAAKSKDGTLLQGQKGVKGFKKEKKTTTVKKSQSSTEIPQTQAKQEKPIPQPLETKPEKIDQFNCKVLGYILLSKPAYQKVIDPLIVGCVYFNIKNQKFYLKMRKIIFLLNYLQNFITIDINSGQQINRLSGKHLIGQSDYNKIYEELLNHHDTVVDLYPLFMRSQVLKKDWPKKDQKFQILTDIYETEIEIDNCSHVIDFTKNSFSVEGSNKVQFLVESKDGDQKKTKLYQYSIVEDENDNNEEGKQDLHKIKLAKDNELIMEQNQLRVFQYDKNVLVVGPNNYQIICQDSFEIEKIVELENQIDENLGKKIQIVNKSEESRLFARQNIEKFNDKSKVPQQDWRMIIENQKGSLDQYTLREQSEIAQLSRQKTVKATTFDLKELVPNDINQLGNLMECSNLGTIALKNNFSHLTSSCLEQQSNQYSHHSWHILNRTNNILEFTFKIPKQYQQSHLRQVDIEISFKKKSNQTLSIKNYSTHNDNSLDSGLKSLKRIPLIVDSVVGAQISDSVQPCYLTFPDNQIFASNYPQPEFIFKHHSNKSFTPQQFIIKSKENREWNGVPISQGVIFMADSLEDLQNTKQFSKFTEKEYKQWKIQRDKYSNIPLLPNEPIAFFDLDDKPEILVPFNNNKSCRYIKFIPTAFRKRPINFSSKPFNSNQAEVQFFGVNGVELESDHRGVVHQDQQLHLEEIKELEIEIKALLNEKSLGQIGELEKVSITELRNAKTSNSLIPVIALKDMQMQNLIGVARATIMLKEDHTGGLEEISLQIPSNQSNELWEVSGVTLSVKAFADKSAIFSENILQENKPRLRHYLLDPSQFDKILKQLLEIVQEQGQDNEEQKIASLQCILTFLRTVNLDKNKSMFLKEFKENTSIEKILSEEFISQSPSYQVAALRYLEAIGFLSEKQQFIAQFIQKQMDKLFERSWNNQNLQGVFDLIKWCEQESKSVIQTKMVEMLFSKICNDLLPYHQTEENIIIRSKFSINAFPLDQGYTGDSSNEGAQNQTKTLDGYLSVLNCSFEMAKVNTLYYYNVDFRGKALVDKLKLYFEQDTKNLFKISVKIIVPDSNGCEQLLQVKKFDENTYTQICERAHKDENIKYFGSVVKSSQENESTLNQSKEELKSKDEEVKDSQTSTGDLNNLNCVVIDLNGYIGRYLKIQVELIDSFRTVHKPTPLTQILIRPEFYGQIINLNEPSEEENSKLSSFHLKEYDQSYLLGNKTLGGISYQLYQIPHNQLSRLGKALLFVMPHLQKGKEQLQIEGQTSEKQKEHEQMLIQERSELQDMLDSYIIDSKSQSKSQIQNKVNEVSRLQVMVNQTKTTPQVYPIGLSYILNLSDLLSSQIVQFYKQTPQILTNSSLDFKNIYIKLFTHFGVQDQLNFFPNVQKLLEVIFQNIKDKSDFIFSILKEFLFEADSMKTQYVNQQNLIQFIQNLQILDFNELLSNYLNLSGYSENKISITNEKSVQEQLELMEQQPDESSHQCTSREIFLLIKLIDDLKDQPQVTYKLDLLFKVLSHFISQNYQQLNQFNQSTQTLIEYSLSLAQKFSLLKQSDLAQVPTDCQLSILQLMILSIQMNSKIISKSVKSILIELVKKDSSNLIIQVVGALIQWFKNKENANSYIYYQQLNKQNSGSGSKEFIKHLSQVFKLYTKLLKHSKLAENQLDDTYKQLGEIMADVLQALTVDDNSHSMDESNQQVVWIQLYQSLSYLDQQTLAKRNVFEQLAHKFFKLPPVLQEYLYPKFHQKTEKFLDQSTQKDPSIIIQALGAFMKQGFTVNTQVSFCISDGLLNIIQSGKKEVQNQTVIVSKFNEGSIHSLLQILCSFLTEHVNKGVYHGVTGSYIDTIMRLDLGIQIAVILLNAVDSKKQNAFEQYIKGTEDKVKLIETLLEWLFINCQSQKGKNSPACEKIYALSGHIEQLLYKVSVDDEMVAQSLHLLMKIVLKIDSKLRQLIHQKQINYERGIQIQKVCNQLFLSLFKTWVQNDTVAKRFLTELNGFDFLLDRLFSKSETSKKQEQSQHNLKERLLNLTLDQDEDMMEMLNSVKTKLNKGVKQDKVSSPMKEEKKSLPGALPPISKKQTAILPSTKFEEEVMQNVNTEQANKEVEAALQQEDFGRAMKLIWSSDKEKGVGALYATTQWNKFKNGTKNKIYNFQMNDPKYEYEYVLQFDLEKVVQVNDIQIGLLYNWSTYDVDTQYEPLSFIVEGSKEKDQESDWKVLLKPIQDGGYELNSIKVYGHNFVESFIQTNSIDKIETSLNSIGCKECRYITFKLRKPLMCCTENSLYVGCLKKIKAYGFSFISINGISLEDKPIYPYLVDLQKENSLEVLSKFFSGEFTEAFELIADQPQIIEKIKSAFDKLAVLLDNKAALVKPIFLSICAKNENLSDWIMMERLISLDPHKIKKEQIRFLGDIISSSRDKQLQKLNQIKKFIIGQVNRIQQDNLSLEHSQQILFSRYINLFSSKFREYSNFITSSHEEIVLEYEVSDLENIVSIMQSCEAGKSKLFNSLTRLALLLLIPPAPFTNKTIQINEYVDKLLDTQDENKSLSYLLFSSIIASTNQKALDAIIQREKVEWSLDQLKLKGELKSNQSYQLAQILYNCSRQQQFRVKYRPTVPFQLYESLKNSNLEEKGSLMIQNSSDEHIKIIVQTIKDIILGGEEEEDKLSSLLKYDLIEASNRQDVPFINKVIVPILHAEENIPISISILDPNRKQLGLQPIFAGQEVESKGPSFFLKTDILSSKQKQSLMKNFKELAGDKVENFSKLVGETKWDLIFQTKTPAIDSSKFRTFVTATQNKSNIMILVHCNLNGQKAVLGGFSSKPFPSLGETWAHEFDYQIPYGEANFVFYYTPEKELHFTMTHNKPFGYIYTDYEEGGALSVSGDFFLISWSYEFQNSCGNIYDMKCIEDPSIMTFYSNMEIQNCEIWWANTNEKSSISDGKVKHELKNHRWFKDFSPYNFFRENLIFEVNKNIKLSKVAEEILGKGQIFVTYPSEDKLDQSTSLEVIYGQKVSQDPILDLVSLKKEVPKEEEKAQIVQLTKQVFSEFEVGGGDASGLAWPVDPLKKVEQKKEEEVKEETFEQPLLKRFEAKGGILDLIKAAKEAVKLYQSEKLKEMWGLWLAEIESFSQLPTFFSTFSTSDREKESIVYKLIDGEFDRTMKGNEGDAQRLLLQQEELHIEMVKYSYQIVNEVFDKHEGAELRDLCLKNGTFERFIERIGQLSSEKKRTKAVKGELEKEVKKEEVKQEMKKEKKKEQEDPYKKRKGVGYTTGVGTQWNVNEYLKSKESKSQQAANIVNIMKNVIKSRDWQAPIEIKNLILESAMLPTLESAFRSGSLLEMAKDFELNMAYLGFVQEVVKHETLIDVLLDIGEEYEPRQKEPINKLLSKMEELSSIFLGCLISDAKDSEAFKDKENKPKQLAEKIHDTHVLVSEKLALQQQIENQQSLEKILTLPLSEAYFKLLSGLRFEYMTMKDSGIYQHSYQMELSKNTNPPMTKLVRLAQEIADLSNSLPCDYTNGVFCRVDKERVDMMKCMIMGASGTPYAHGAFVYDLFFENSYPNVPPKCQLTTTGGQTVRFNPNLYNNGKVCLSLLGTWRGSSTENWDAKLSTILQVLLSIQAIIMSNEVYFNEPGYEHEAGTPEGEKKNEGYANIVRYCNVKFAIIDAIKNPPKGFEKVIKRNFYLKKNEVLKEVKEWVDRAKTTEAVYTGLVYDHNYQWAPQISQPGKYAELMEQIYAELKTTLESIKSPFEDENTGKIVERKFSKNDFDNEKGGKQFLKAEDAQFGDIDVSYDSPDKQVDQKSMNINDEKVQDRWSRYIGVMGKDAVAKQAESRILLAGLGPLGVEIAKNIVLAGCKELILFDEKGPSLMDIGGGQFFLTEKDVEDFNNATGEIGGKVMSRAEYCKDKIQQLNYYVKVSVLNIGTDLVSYLKNESDLKVVVLALDITGITDERVVQINEICREKGVGFIHACQNGLFSKIFNDFGGLAQKVEGEEEKQFIVIDKDTEELQEVMIDNITVDEKDGLGLVTLQQGFKHKFQDGDKVVIKEVVGMKKVVQEGQIDTSSDDSINGTTHTVKQINPQQFKIGKIDGIYTPYEGNGLAKQIKVPKFMRFKSYQQIENDYLMQKANEDKEGKWKEYSYPFDQNLQLSDFEKMDNNKFAHWCYIAVSSIISQYPGQEEFQFQDIEASVSIHVQKLAKENGYDLEDKKSKEKIQKFIYTFLFTFQSYFAPLAAFLGGIVSQEIVKAITQKFVPIDQFIYFDFAELFPEFSVESEATIYEMNTEVLILQEDKYLSLRQCLGNEVVDKIQNAKLFMIGAGAIGCELLKNYAMIGLGSKSDGHIILTDPDVIEVSNLNRQFLFREKHLRKPKSQTAAASAVQMNKDLQGHIYARLDKIHDGTASIYNEQFFKDQTIVTNALDNVQARLYIDSRCVAARTPLLDSGTLGPKGHVQTVIPFKTESYASQNDPEDNTQIPHCTLKMFPEETLHCVEWAKDIFGHLFTLQSQNYNKLVLSDLETEPNFSDQQELIQIKKVLKTLQRKPYTFDDCIFLSRLRFQKNFHNDIKQLLHVYPLDKKTKEGRPFWSLPKRPPHPQEFDKTNPLHISFNAACACLFATIFDIKIPYEQPRSQEAKQDMANKAYLQKIPEFQVNDMKASQIESQVEKEQKKGEQEQEEQQLHPKHDIEDIKQRYQIFVAPLKQKQKSEIQKMQVQEFEKDVDDNYHVDFIHSMANIRASNYKLEEMDWLTVKIKAGRIIPALATTTAAIAALQTVEAIKIIKGCKLEIQRNSFLNLAVPSLMMSEPGAPIKTKLKVGLEVTLWDRWEMLDCLNDVTLLDVLEYFEKQFNLASRDVFAGSVPLFINIIQGKDEKERRANLTKPLKEMISIDQDFVDLSITFVDKQVPKDENGNETMIKGVPPVRVYFKQEEKVKAVVAQNLMVKKDSSDIEIF